MSDIIKKITATADILGGDVFFATDDGRDPEFLDNGDLLANGMYIRLNGSDGSVAYISAFELDKSIEVLDQITKGKANQSDIDLLRMLIDDKANQSDLVLLQSEVSTKASQESVDAIITTLNSKANASDVIALTSAVTSKADSDVVEALSEAVTSKADSDVVEALSTAVASKADSSTVSDLQKDVKALEDALDSMTNQNTINAIQNQISLLNDEINKRLTSDSLTGINEDVDELQSDVETIKTRLESAEASLIKKAEKTFVQGQVNEIHSILANMTNAIDEKANKTEVATKASKTDVDNLRTKVTELNTTVGTKVSNLDSNYQTLVNELESKASKAETDVEIAALTASLASKADNLETQRSINTLTTKITALENKDDGLSDVNAAINDLQCNVNAAINEMNATLNTASRQITTHTNQIGKLQEKDLSLEETVKNEWVRVMTPEQYKKLSPIGSTLPNGTPDPRAKKANTIYMLVRYNKPISVYIGEILIAQAEQKGSVGFAYTFPISF